MLAALLFFAAMDVVAKFLAQTFAVPLLVWARYLVNCVLMLIFVTPTTRSQMLVTERPWMHVARSLLLVGTTFCMITALGSMPLAETTAIGFTAPLIVSLLAGTFLNEKMGRVRWFAVVIGFAGVLVIARPSGALSGTGTLLALGAAICNGAYQIFTRKMSPTENTTTMIFYTALIGALVMSLTLPWFFGGTMPSLFQMLLIASLGINGLIGQYLMARAFRRAPASTLAPFTYSQMVWAMLLGWIVFDQLPDALSLVGMLIIVCSGVAVVWLERRPVTPMDDF